MVPWQVATGLTLVIGGVSAILLLDRLDYLADYWGLVLGEHGWAIAAPAATALASVFAATHWAARKAGLGDLGRKVEHIDRGLHDSGAAHDRDLAAALQRDRAAEWGPGRLAALTSPPLPAAFPAGTVAEVLATLAEALSRP